MSHVSMVWVATHRILFYSTLASTVGFCCVDAFVVSFEGVAVVEGRAKVGPVSFGERPSEGSERITSKDEQFGTRVAYPSRGK